METKKTLKYSEFLTIFAEPIKKQIESENRGRFASKEYKGGNLIVGDKLIYLPDDSRELFGMGVAEEDWDDSEHSGLGFVIINDDTEVDFEEYDIEALIADIVAKYPDELPHGFVPKIDAETLQNFFWGNYDVFHDFISEEIN